MTDTRVLVFETTHHALWAEQVATEQGFGAQVVPAPEEAGAACALALEVLAEDAAALFAALGRAGVEFRPYPG